MSYVNYNHMSDDELVDANLELSEKKEEIRADQLKINQVLTDRAQRGVRGVYATKDRPYRKSLRELIEVPTNVSDRDLLKLKGIHTEEEVKGLG
jgi:hypothetical protein